MSDSVLHKISAVDLWVGTLSPKVKEGVVAGVIEPDRFKACFAKHPDVMVQMMKIVGLGETSMTMTAAERDYMLGAQDAVKQFLTLSALEGKHADE